MLAENPVVSDRDDSTFTSFLDADPATFSYRYSDKEKAIIRAFSAYRRYTTSVNSVYMGRENGTFVRSHPRSSPTRFDPRTRPWYLKALASPGIPVHTDAYASVTNTDINIGTVLALQDETGTVYGVLGMDITLDELSRKLYSKILQYEGYFEFWDSNDKVLVSPYSERLFMSGNDSRFNPLNSVQYIKVASNGSVYRFGWPVTEPEGTLVAFVSEKHVFQAIAKRLLEQIVIVAIVLAVVFIVILLTIRHVVLGPIEEISRTLKQNVRPGKSQLLNVSAGKELHDIQEEYNSLVLRMEQEKDEIRKIRMIVLSALAGLVRKRDNETGLHIIRMQKYMDILASSHMVLYPSTGLSPEDVERMVQFSPLHDIGKIAVPDHILKKPSGLSPEEFDEIKRHTSFGKDAVERAAEGAENSQKEEMQTLITLIYSHHERWDGDGYPEGLSGTSIPLYARLMAVVDVYNALTSDRVYRKAYTHEQAVALISKGSGIQFDPEIVDTFLAVEKRFRDVVLLYR